MALAPLLKFPEAIDTIFILKGRPNDNPLIIHVANKTDVLSFANEIPAGFNELADAFWPGPMTLVIPVKSETVPSNARSGLPTAAFRVPAHPETLKLLAMCGALVMPSANLSGRPSSTLPEHVEQDFGQNFPVIDGGGCTKGLESTILIHHGGRWEIIRLGALEPELFKNVLGYVPHVAEKHKGETPLCPGQLYRHYAPKAKLKLVKHFTKDMQGAVIGFSDMSYPPGCKVYRLGLLSSPQVVAENLYAVLRRLDADGLEEAFVDMNFPKDGLWATIEERLIKASCSTPQNR